MKNKIDYVQLVNDLMDDGVMPEDFRIVFGDTQTGVFSYSTCGEWGMHFNSQLLREGVSEEEERLAHRNNYCKEVLSMAIRTGIVSYPTLKDSYNKLILENEKLKEQPQQPTRMKKAIIPALAYSVGTYAVIAFISTEPNPLEWHWVPKVFLALVLLTSAGDIMKKMRLL